MFCAVAEPFVELGFIVPAVGKCLFFIVDREIGTATKNGKCTLALEAANFEANGYAGCIDPVFGGSVYRAAGACGYICFVDIAHVLYSQAGIYTQVRIEIVVEVHAGIDKVAETQYIGDACGAGSVHREYSTIEAAGSIHLMVHSGGHKSIGYWRGLSQCYGRYRCGKGGKSK